VWQTGFHAQPQCSPHQHHGWVSRRNAQDHFALNFRMHSTQLLPPVAIAPSAMSAQCLLPSWRHGLATTGPSRTVWRNATGKNLPPVNAHGHAGVSPRPRNDDECRTLPAGRWKYADDADGPTADGSTHVDEPLCPQSVAQPDAGVFLMSRGG
jgi:hypothetical protein